MTIDGHTDFSKSIQPFLSFFPPTLRSILSQLSPTQWESLEEIRLRQARPLMVTTHDSDFFLSSQGKTNRTPDGAYLPTVDDVTGTLHLMTGHSLYAVEEELRTGFITLSGGHRVGLCGRAVLDGGLVKNLKHITGLNVRLARQVPGAAEDLIRHIVSEGRPLHTLIVSPPRCGKTTVLRDVARRLSNGIPRLSVPGQKVVIVDERSEIASCFMGVPQNDVGIRTDVLDACPKAEGISMVLRGMSPEVIVTDEIGKEADVQAIRDAQHAGVVVIATAHGGSKAEIERRPAMAALLSEGGFERIILLSRRCGPGTIEHVYRSSRGNRDISEVVQA